MTSLYSPRPSPQTDPPDNVAAVDAARPPASDAVKAAHADERYNRGVVEAANRAATGRRSAGIIGSVIAIGVLAWLIVTLL